MVTNIKMPTDRSQQINFITLMLALDLMLLTAHNRRLYHESCEPNTTVNTTE